MDCLGVRCGKARFLYGVDRDQVDVNGEGGRVLGGAEAGIEQACQPFGGFGRVILARNEGIFKGNSSACGLVVPTAGVQQLVDAPFAVDGHDGASRFIVRGVEGDGEGDGEAFLCQAVDLIDQTAGGEGNMAIADIASLHISDPIRPYDRTRTLIHCFV